MPNQRIISIKGKEPCDTDNIYAKINIKAMLNAMKNLTPKNFQVWLYLAKNQNNYTFSLSPKAVQEETGIVKSSVQEGIRTLIRKKYLIQRNDGSNIYDFYEKPQEEQEKVIQIQVHKEEQKDSNNGFVF